MLRRPCITLTIPGKAQTLAVNTQTICKGVVFVMAREVNAPNQQSTIVPGSTAAGLFRSEPQAERAIDALTAAGFSKKDIGVAIASDGKADTRSGVTDKIRSLFSPSERQEYDSGNDLDVLHHMGLRDADASFYRNSLYRGGILVTVN